MKSFITRNKMEVGIDENTKKEVFEAMIKRYIHTFEIENDCEIKEVKLHRNEDNDLIKVELLK